MAIEPEHPTVTVGESQEERQRIIEELEQMSPGDDAPPLKSAGEPTSDDVFVALQSQTLGSGALGTDPYTR